MKLLNLKLFTLSIFFLGTNISWAQIETLEYAHSADTCVPANVNDYNRLIKYFMAEKEDVKQLYKINMMQLPYFRLNPAFETRLGDNSSIQFEFNTGIAANTFNSPNCLFFFPEINIKHFHNYKSRQQLGKNTNGFSGNYITYGIEANLYNSFGSYTVANDGSHIDSWRNYTPISEDDFSIVFRNSKYTPNENAFAFKLGYGLQRRIGNIGYISAFARLSIGTNSQLNRVYFTPDLGIKAGFAISKKRK